MQYFLFPEATTIKQTWVKIRRQSDWDSVPSAVVATVAFQRVAFTDFLFDLLFSLCFLCLLFVIPSRAACSEVILQHWSLWSVNHTSVCMWRETILVALDVNVAQKRELNRWEQEPKPIFLEVSYLLFKLNETHFICGWWHSTKSHGYLWPGNTKMNILGLRLSWDLPGKWKLRIGVVRVVREKKIMLAGKAGESFCGELYEAKRFGATKQQCPHLSSS